MTFASVLSAHDFRRIKSHANGTSCWITADGWRYCEVYTETYGKRAWLVGRGLPNGGYPGGRNYDKPEEVERVLTNPLNK